ncbi:MAG: 3-phosphoshikimate 1-carboxyvinyltransferase [Armatimonadetes bacterium]|nr:3-phosphoshikimate 1-carboxyvinyltransferase [Armatimonadota bacterium]
MGRRLVAAKSVSLRGSATVPGDKSISHRVAILGAMASGTTEAHNFLAADDCLRTLYAIHALGATVVRNGNDVYITSEGYEAWRQLEGVLDLGNSGTGLRLLMGAVAGRPFETTLDGDESLRRRPMDRVAHPLRAMGSQVTGQGERLTPPVTIRGGHLRGIVYEQPVASAQVKSAVILAGLQAEGITTVIQPQLSRNHTELIMAAFGGRVATDGLKVTVEGGQQLHAATLTIPGDFSSAAFLIAAAVLVPGSEVTIHGVGLNPTRTGLLSILAAMGARIAVGPLLRVGEEPWGTLTVFSSELRGVLVEGDLIPAAIDELPLVAVLATQAEGETVVRQARELRIKESDRIATMAENLRAMGADIKETEDGWVIRGPTPLRGTQVRAEMDHRVAMALAVAGLVADGETVVEGAEAVGTSFPSFAETLASLGANVRML